MNKKTREYSTVRQRKFKTKEGRGRRISAKNDIPPIFLTWISKIITNFYPSSNSLLFFFFYQRVRESEKNS